VRGVQLQLVTSLLQGTTRADTYSVTGVIISIPDILDIPQQRATVCSATVMSVTVHSWSVEQMPIVASQYVYQNCVSGFNRGNIHIDSVAI
jgi:hypothetical protein